MLRFAELTGRGLITLSGDDRVSFLQGLVSNDVTKLESGRALWSALLTAQGKFRHDFFLIPDGDRILIDCEGADRLMDLGQTLRRYVLRADAQLGIDQTVACFAIWGDELSALPADGTATSVAGGILFADPRLPAMGYRLIAPPETARQWLTDKGATEQSRADWDAHRIPLGIPDGARDIQPDKAILLEHGFDELHGLDWKKGCYMGQELTARTKYRGLTKKRLLPVRLSGEAPEEGSQITTADGKDAGTLFSIQGNWGLALLRLDPVKKKTALTSGGAALQPEIPAWITLPD
ncbi:MAG: folate-binding protein [Alphaproteobacteria bacterium]|nr:folate-binding protein [Alphaproteobacteria bacterium]